MQPRQDDEEMEKLLESCGFLLDFDSIISLSEPRPHRCVSSISLAIFSLPLSLSLCPYQPRSPKPRSSRIPIRFKAHVQASLHRSLEPSSLLLSILLPSLSLLYHLEAMAHIIAHRYHYILYSVTPSFGASACPGSPILGVTSS